MKRRKRCQRGVNFNLDIASKHDAPRAKRAARKILLDVAVASKSISAASKASGANFFLAVAYKHDKPRVVRVEQRICF